MQQQFGQLSLSKICPACGKQFGAGESVCDADQSPLRLRDSDPLLATVIGGRYRLTAILGTGGWGRVYAARHQGLNKMVAVKIMHGHLIERPGHIGRFEQEAQAACELRHPNLASVYDYGTTESGQPFLVMDLLSGKSLEEVLASEHHLAVARALNIFKQICLALAEAHGKGVIHRDIKPGNIMLSLLDSRQEIAQLVDFGLAKVTAEDGRSLAQLTETGETLGTPYYMAPEQCLGNRLDGRADIYALGCLMYECLTGVVPFAGATAFECMSNHVKLTAAPMAETAPDVKIPALLEDIIFKCLQKDAGKRFQNAAQVRSELERVPTATAASMSSPVLFLKRPWRMLLHRLAQNKPAIICGALCLVALLGTGWFEAENAWQSDPSKLPPPERWTFYMRRLIHCLDTGDYQKALKNANQAIMISQVFPTADRRNVSLANQAVIYHILAAAQSERGSDVRRIDAAQMTQRQAGFGQQPVDDAQAALLSRMLDTLTSKGAVDKHELEELGKRVNDFCSGRQITHASVRQLAEKNNRILSQHLGSDNLTYAMSCGHLGFGCYLAGDYKGALSWLKEDYDIRQARVPISDAELCRLIGSLGSAYYLNDDFQHAKQYLLLAATRLRYIPEVEGRADILGDLARTYERLKDCDNAYREWKGLFAYWQRQGNYTQADFPCLQIVFVGDRMHRDAQTEKFLLACRAALAAQYGQDYDGVATCNLGLSELYLLQKRLPEAESAAWLACTARQMKDYPAATTTYRALQTLARVFMAQHRYAEAIPLYQVMLAGVERNLSSQDKGLWLDGLSKLAYLHQMCGDNSSAQEFMRRFHIALAQLKPSRNGYDCARPIDATFSALHGTGLTAADYDRLLELIAVQRRTIDPDGCVSYLPSVRAFDACSRIYALKGDMPQALSASRQACQRFQQGQIAYYWLPASMYRQYAAVLNALGQATAAVQADKEAARYPAQSI